MSIIFKLLYILVSFAETLIIFRIIMTIIGADQTHVFVSWVYSISDILITPFKGITVEHIYLDKFKIEVTPIIALIFFSIIGFILSELSKSLKRTD